MLQGSAFTYWDASSRPVSTRQRVCGISPAIWISGRPRPYDDGLVAVTAEIGRTQVHDVAAYQESFHRSIGIFRLLRPTASQVVCDLLHGDRQQCPVLFQSAPIGYARASNAAPTAWLTSRARYWVTPFIKTPANRSANGPAALSTSAGVKPLTYLTMSKTLDPVSDDSSRARGDGSPSSSPTSGPSSTTPIALALKLRRRPLHLLCRSAGQHRAGTGGLGQRYRLLERGQMFGHPAGTGLPKPSPGLHRDG